MDYSNGYLGIDVDIFPLDGVPENESDYCKWYNKLHNLYKFYYFSILDWRTQKNFILKIFIIISKIFNLKKLILKIAKREHEKYPYKSEKYVSTVESLFDSQN